MAPARGTCSAPEGSANVVHLADANQRWMLMSISPLDKKTHATDLHLQALNECEAARENGLISHMLQCALMALRRRTYR